MRTCLLAVAALLLLAPPTRSEEIKGWFMAGSDPASYEMVRDAAVMHGSATSVRLASTKESKGFGTIMQTFSATHYTGKRVRLSASVKTQDVGSWAGLWMRVDDDSNPVKVLAFDNMQTRALKGTTDWSPASVVLDVASNASSISFGILLDGQGKVWMSDLKFEPVPTSVPTTGTAMDRKKQPEPENLDFKK
jgi:hypothetical protein